PRTYPCPWRFYLTVKAASIRLHLHRIDACLFKTFHQPRKLPWLVLFTQKGTSFMLAQVAQVLHFNDHFPARAIQNGQLSQNFKSMSHEPFAKNKKPQRNTLIGNPDNE